MTRRPRILTGEIYFPIIIGLHLVLWAVDLVLHGGPYTLSEGENPIQRVLGEVMSSWVITVFGINLLMATRARWVEQIFGGLDKMYVIHRRAGVIAMILLLVHFGTVPRYPEFTIGKPLGFASMVLIFIGIAISVAPVFKRRIPYSRWLSMHRLMGPFFVLGVLHAYTVPTLISQLPLVRTYVLLMALMGVLSWLYRVFLHGRVHPRLRYEISGVEHHGGSTVALEMNPTGESLAFLPGQFAFFGFAQNKHRECHPFTMASHPTDSGLRIAIKAAGDFTETIQSQAKEGDTVTVEGPYGYLTRSGSTTSRQLWIAGGIGITPFLALAQDLQNDQSLATLYWTVPTRAEAHFDDELRTLADQTPGLTYNLWLSNDSGRLSLADIPEAEDVDNLDVFICGPAALRDSVTDELRSRGLPAGNIHSEEFMFR